MASEELDQPLITFTQDVGNESIRLKIIGLGGAGNNAVDRLKLDNLTRVNLAVVNTDSQVLSISPLEEQLLIGRATTRGLGAGGEAEIGRQAAEADRAQLAQLAGGADLIFLLAGLGGGTGSGATPVLAEVAAEAGAVVIAFVTLPFTFEGQRRHRQADESLSRLREICHAVIPLPNDVLLQQMDEDASVLDAFALADQWISRGVRGIWSMLFQTGLINVDFASLRKAFENRGGKTLFGVGSGKGEDCAGRALNDLLLCPLLHTPEFSRRADSLIVNIEGGTDLSMAKVNEIMGLVTEKFGSRYETVLGAVIDERMQNTVEICVLGTTEINPGQRLRQQQNRPQMPAHIAKNIESAPHPTPSPMGSPRLFSKSTRRRKLQREDSQGEFQFAGTDEQRGCFDATERNYYNGEDLDVPTYLRRGLKIRL